MKTLKKYNDFLNEDLEEVKDKIASNLEDQETDNNDEEMKKDIEDNVNKQVDNINNKKKLIEQKIKMLTDHIGLIDNEEDKLHAEDQINKLKIDLEKFDTEVARIEDQKKEIEQ